MATNETNPGALALQQFAQRVFKRMTATESHLARTLQRLGSGDAWEANDEITDGTVQLFAHRRVFAAIISWMEQEEAAPQRKDIDFVAAVLRNEIENRLRVQNSSDHTASLRRQYEREAYFEVQRDLELSRQIINGA